ncbi:MAG: TSUP family transporter [Elusimicrobia bacterium]|nr:TSUP family transporter [Elusimicrobiota bacterium]
MFDNPHFYSLMLLAFFVCLAGCIDAIAGGGGLITLPAYLHFGLRPGLLLGTNKLSSSMGTTVAAFKFLKDCSFGKSFLFILIVLAAAGSSAGARVISLVPPAAVKYLLIVTLPPIAVFLAVRHNFGLSDSSSSLGEKGLLARAGAIAFFISFYDGMLGPGTGTFLAVAFARFCRYDLLSATALSKLINLTSNLAALATFLALGKVNIRLGLAMGCAGMAGNYLGSHLALKKGVWVIRPALLLVSGSLLAKIAWDMVR